MFKTRRQEFLDMINEGKKAVSEMIIKITFGEVNEEYLETLHYAMSGIEKMENFYEKFIELEDEMKKLTGKHEDLLVKYENMKKPIKKPKYSVIVYEDDTAEVFETADPSTELSYEITNLPE